MNSARSNNLGLKYQRFTTSGCKDTGIRKFELVVKTQFIFLSPFSKHCSFQEQEAEPEQEQEQEQEQKEETRGGLRKFRIDSDITDYDYSTDSESLRFFFSETDPSGVFNLAFY